ncbi:cysteine desulfurase-like protein [Nostocoides sp. F2B08]|uniref:cysteine desulfurase-like protein n=1 Tax=Nostocoides sp. F2B08 TaxID=2653936 RepID=UPI001263C6B8|nr:cysteine desulfurase-like protein [Tetrasphaera sp. F2B08]KAB7741421.1 cysteine desulfurase-like protein [Tetrasphaera sp. F2B08]
MAYDVDAIRSRFPALREGAAHFDGPGGTQTPDVVAAAVADTLTSAIANRGTVTAAEQRADQVVAECRAALGDLLAVDPGAVVFGRSATQLTYDLSRALAKTWGPGDEVVVSRLDHDSNVCPWVQAAEAVGATVRWADFDPATGTQLEDHFAPVLSERTRLVAMTAASNLIGTRPPVRTISHLVHDVGALLWVDGVHATAHDSVDVAALGADFWTCSPYKLLGPHCGVVAAAHRSLLEAVRPDKLLPSTDDVPERFELGTLPYELMAGTTAAVDFIAGLADPGGPGPGPDVEGVSEMRRERILASYAALHEHEARLLARLEGELRDMPGMRVYSNAERRTPTMLFTIDGHDSTDVYRALAERGVNAPASNFYAIECSRHLGLGDEGGVRIGLAPYTNDADVERLIRGLREIVAG